MNVGNGDSSEETCAFRFLTEVGVVSPKPNKLIFRSRLCLPIIDLSSLRRFSESFARISSAVVEVNKRGASVRVLKGFDVNAGWADGSGTGSSHKVGNSALIFAPRSFSGEVIFKAVMRSMSKSSSGILFDIVNPETGRSGVKVCVSCVQTGRLSHS